MNKNTQKLNISYIGEGIKNGEIDLESFATSILNFGKMVNIVKNHFNIDNLDIKIIATKEGSFEVDLVLISEGWETFKNLFGSNGANALANVMTILGCGGIFGLYKHLKGKEPKKIEQNGDNISITNESNITLVFNSGVVILYQNPNLREYAENFIKSPLDTDSIDEIKIKSNDEVLEIKKDEKDYFRKSLYTKDSDKTTRVYTQTFSIISLTFNKNNKWKLADGRGNINATIKDEEFLQRIENDEVQFAKGDKLVCEVELIEDLSEEKIASTYSILKVKDHIKSPRARRLPGL